MGGNPAAGVLVLLLALYLLLAFFSGRLEWLFRLGDVQREAAAAAAAAPTRPSTSGR